MMQRSQAYAHFDFAGRDRERRDEMVFGVMFCGRKHAAAKISCASIELLARVRDCRMHLFRRGTANVIASGNRSFQRQYIEYVGVDQR
jgi:hypothetical protein